MNPNLIPFNELTQEEQRKIAQSGGKASVEARREKKRLKEAFKVLLDMQDEDAMAGVDQTNAMAIALAMVKKAKGGDVQAGVFVRDTAGEKPVDEQIVEVGELRKLEVEIKE
ncbi:MAG: hypothetical protein IIY81_10450 [Lachnospiraceae bacterium]|nr:hypothetical protein [Lachnospiraceae bacterium]